MFVHPESRGKNIASQILEELESCERIIVSSCILETGKRYPEAIALYKRMVTITTNYGQYEGIDDSVCFSKSFLIRKGSITLMEPLLYIINVAILR
jgi:GNAT superfamily N-acetyltransferase